jgi:16S rRNA (guanine527-N7)-methyltransferase
VSQAQVLQFEALLNQGGNGREFSDKENQQLLAYYQLVLKWNNRLHLTTLTQPEQFFQRHILESVLTASYVIPTVRQIWDLGSGLGIPGIPLAILRPKLSIYLVESSRKKALFLEEVMASLGLANASVITARIESLEKLPDDSCLTARAVEKMERLIKQMMILGQDSAQMLFLGSADLKKRVAENLDEGWVVQSQPIAGTERRMLINVIRST